MVKTLSKIIHTEEFETDHEETMSEDQLERRTNTLRYRTYRLWFKTLFIRDKLHFFFFKEVKVKQRLYFRRYKDFDGGWNYREYYTNWEKFWENEEIIAIKPLKLKNHE